MGLTSGAPQARTALVGVFTLSIIALVILVAQRHASTKKIVSGSRVMRSFASTFMAGSELNIIRYLVNPSFGLTQTHLEAIHQPRHASPMPATGRPINRHRAWTPVPAGVVDFKAMA